MVLLNYGYFLLNNFKDFFSSSPTNVFACVRVCVCVCVSLPVCLYV